MEKSFLSRMHERLGITDEKEQKPVVAKKEPKKKKVMKEEAGQQEMIPVHIMNSDMEDFFYEVGHRDFFNFLNKFAAGEYCYTEGGVFGAEGVVINKGKPNWMDEFRPLAKNSKSTKTQFYIDATNPMETIKEVIGVIGQKYPDLIVNL